MLYKLFEPTAYLGQGYVAFSLPALLEKRKVA